MACGQPTLFVDRDAVQEVVERLETTPTQTRYIGEAAGKSFYMVAQPAGRRRQDHPESKCSDGHRSLQTQECFD